MAREVTKHGLSGYRLGCKCEVCRAAKREYMRGYRSRRRADSAPATDTSTAPALEDVARPVAVDFGSLDLASKPGPIERAFLRDLRRPDRKVAFRRHLIRLARLNARVLDQVGTLDRLDLISPIELRQNEILQRIARLGFAGLEDDLDGGPINVPDDASALMNELLSGDDAAGE